MNKDMEGERRAYKWAVPKRMGPAALKSFLLRVSEMTADTQPSIASLGTCTIFSFKQNRLAYGSA